MYKKIVLSPDCSLCTNKNCSLNPVCLQKIFLSPNPSLCTKKYFCHLITISAQFLYYVLISVQKGQFFFYLIYFFVTRFSIICYIFLSPDSSLCTKKNCHLILVCAQFLYSELISVQKVFCCYCYYCYFVILVVNYDQMCIHPNLLGLLGSSSFMSSCGRYGSCCR